jgi:hypothetical protein
MFMYRLICCAMGLVAIVAVGIGGAGCGDSTSGTQTTKVITIQKKDVSSGGHNKGNWKNRKPISPTAE